MKKIFLSGVMVVAACVAQPVLAQLQCGNYFEGKNILEEDHGEYVRFQGLTANGVLIRLWFSEETETWTITFSADPTVICHLEDGFSGQLVPLKPNL